MGVCVGVGVQTLSWNRATRSLTSGRDVRPHQNLILQYGPWQDARQISEMLDQIHDEGASWGGGGGRY